MSSGTASVSGTAAHGRRPSMRCTPGSSQSTGAPACTSTTAAWPSTRTSTGQLRPPPGSPSTVRRSLVASSANVASLAPTVRTSSPGHTQIGASTAAFASLPGAASPKVQP